LVSAGYSHHHSQPHPAGTTTKSVAYSLSVARLGDGIGVATFTPITVTAAANIPGICEMAKASDWVVLPAMGFAVVMGVAGRNQALDRPR